MKHRLVGAVFALVALVTAPAFAGGPEAPGTLISQTPIKDTPAGAAGWRIRYWSIAANGTPVEITGVVFVPGGPAPTTGRDIVAWGHGTVGITAACAPSQSPQLFENIAGLKTMLERGYIVAATDLQGLGTPGPHPYLVGLSSGHAILDSVRAARALPGVNAGKRYVVWGESQGAHAVLWAGQLAKAYAPDLDLVGIAAAAPPTDLAANFKKITNTPAHALLTSYTTASWSEIYGIKLSTFANVFGRYVIHKLAQDCVHKDPVSAATNVGVLLLSNQIPYNLSEEWAKLLRENSPSLAHVSVPVFIAQGSADQVVIPDVTREFAIRTCHAGLPTRYVSVEGGNHTTIAQRSQEATLAWIADRFANQPPLSDCDKLEDTMSKR